MEINNVLILAAFGVLGYALTKLAVSPVPLLLGFVLGPLLEASFRRTLAVSRGDYSVFFTRSLSLALLLAATALVISALIPAIRRRHTALASNA